MNYKIVFAYCCTILKIYSFDDTFLKHIKMIQELKARKTKKFEQVSSGKEIDLENLLNSNLCNSQTFAYLNAKTTTPNLFKNLARTAVEYSYKNLSDSEKAKAKTIIESALQKECQHKDRDYVFYHGAAMQVWLLQRVVERIQSWAQLIPHDPSFAYLRSPIDYAEETVDDFLAREKPDNPETWKGKLDKAAENIGGMFDQVPHIRERLISANISLFGNSTGFSKGEANLSSSIYFWLAGISLIGHDIIRRSLEPLFEKYKLDLYYLLDIEQLFEQLKSKGPSYGVLLQIFIPKEIVDNIAYPSLIGGLPLENLSESHLKMSNLLNMFLSKKVKFEPESTMDFAQARLLVTPTIYNPKAGITIYQYSLANQQQIKSIETRIDALLDKLFADWVQRLPTILSGEEKKPEVMSEQDSIKLKTGLSILAETATTTEKIEEQLGTIYNLMGKLSIDELEKFLKKSITALEGIKLQDKQKKLSSKITELRDTLGELGDFIQSEREKAQETKEAKPKERAKDFPVLRLAKYMHEHMAEVNK